MRFRPPCYGWPVSFRPAASGNSVLISAQKYGIWCQGLIRPPSIPTSRRSADHVAKGLAARRSTNGSNLRSQARATTKTWQRQVGEFGGTSAEKASVGQGMWLFTVIHAAQRAVQKSRSSAPELELADVRWISAGAAAAEDGRHFHDPRDAVDPSGMHRPRAEVRGLASPPRPGSTGTGPPLVAPPWHHSMPFSRCSART